MYGKIPKKINYFEKNPPPCGAILPSHLDIPPPPSILAELWSFKYARKIFVAKPVGKKKTAVKKVAPPPPPKKNSKPQLAQVKVLPAKATAFKTAQAKQNAKAAAAGNSKPIFAKPMKKIAPIEEPPAMPIAPAVPTDGKPRKNQAGITPRELEVYRDMILARR